MKAISKKDKENKSNQIKVRVKLQTILQENMRTPIGMFHGKELNESGFVNDLFKNFDITLKKI